MEETVVDVAAVTGIEIELNVVAIGIAVSGMTTGVIAPNAMTGIVVAVAVWSGW